MPFPRTRAHRFPGKLAQRRSAFTLVELLVVVAVIAMLVSILLPAVARGRVAARIVAAHAELRQIEIALRLYQDEHAGELPPTRFSCATRSAYELPVELGARHYLPYHEKFVRTEWGDGFIGTVQMRDVFDPANTYKYRAVGPAILNEYLLLEPPDGASLWVPTAFPDCGFDEVREHKDPRKSPVRYAIWSVGPDPDSPKFVRTPGRMPLPRRFWCEGATDTGVITHFQGRDGRAYKSP